jgi:hypothetical protein
MKCNPLSTRNQNIMNSFKAPVEIVNLLKMPKRHKFKAASQLFKDSCDQSHSLDTYLQVHLSGSYLGASLGVSIELDDNSSDLYV